MYVQYGVLHGVCTVGLMGVDGHHALDVTGKRMLA